MAFGVKPNNDVINNRVKRGQTPVLTPFLAEPVAEQRRLLPGDAHDRLALVIKGHAVARARAVLGVELAKLRVSNLGEREIERPFENDVADCLVWPTPRFAA